MLSSVNATASDRPPTIALAMDAVPCGLLVPWPGAYHSQTILSLRMTSSAFVFRSATLSLSASSFALDTPWLSGEAVVQSHGEAAARRHERAGVSTKRNTAVAIQPRRPPKRCSRVVFDDFAFTAWHQAPEPSHLVRPEMAS